VAVPLAGVLSVLLILGGGAWRMRAQLAGVLQGVQQRIAASHARKPSTPGTRTTTPPKGSPPATRDPRAVELPGGQIVPRDAGIGRAPAPVRTAPTIVGGSAPPASGHAPAPNSAHPAEPGPTTIGVWPSTPADIPENSELVPPAGMTPSTPPDDRVTVVTIAPDMIGGLPPSPDKSAGSSSSAAATPITDAAAYLPAPNTVFQFQEWQDNGEQVEGLLITASLGAPLLVSTTQIIFSHTITAAPVASHYLLRGNGLYRVMDAQPTVAEPCLPARLAPGAKLSVGNETVTIVSVGKTCELDFGTLTNCLIVDHVYPAKGYRLREYWAPGCGIVRTDSAAGKTLRKLVSTGSISAQQALEQVKDAAPNYRSVRVK